MALKFNINYLKHRAMSSEKYNSLNKMRVKKITIVIKFDENSVKTSILSANLKNCK